MGKSGTFRLLPIKNTFMGKSRALGLCLPDSPFWRLSVFAIVTWESLRGDFTCFLGYAVMEPNF